jgi:hypothetical protein
MVTAVWTGPSQLIAANISRTLAMVLAFRAKIANGTFFLVTTQTAAAVIDPTTVGSLTV